MPGSDGKTERAGEVVLTRDPQGPDATLNEVPDLRALRPLLGESLCRGLGIYPLLA
jgi:hypothetical protein